MAEVAVSIEPRYNRVFGNSDEIWMQVVLRATVVPERGAELGCRWMEAIPPVTPERR